MKVIKIDKKNECIELIPQLLDDLWHLEKVIESGDIVSSQTERRIKPKIAGQEPIRKKLFLDIKVTEIDFNEFVGTMKISGRIVGGSPADLIELGAHHSLTVEPGNLLRIKKDEWKNYQIDRIKKSEESSKRGKILIIVLDDERADVAIIKDIGVKQLATIWSGKQGKMYGTDYKVENYFNEIIKVLKDKELTNIIIAGPGFTKENFRKYLQEKEENFNISVVSINSVGITGIKELIKKNLPTKIIEDFEIVKEEKLVDKVFEEIGKNGNISYGLKEVKNAVNVGAVETMIISEKILIENRTELEPIMNTVESTRGKITIIPKNHDTAKKLESIGGIAALLRYKIDYE